jgi:hypothetical protein
MPASVVLPANTAEAVNEMLDGIPLPNGFDRSKLKAGAIVRDRYQLGARVSGAVACAWIGQWVQASRSGDAVAATAAVEAMQTSRRWPILREMNREGDYPEVLWGLAVAMKSNTDVRGGKPTTVAVASRSSLGC